MVFQGLNLDVFVGQIDGEGDVKRMVLMVKKVVEDRGVLFEEVMVKHLQFVFECWVGIDEMGKGDYFGFFIIVVVVIECSRVLLLVELGIVDSKKFSDKFVCKIMLDM